MIPLQYTVDWEDSLIMQQVCRDLSGDWCALVGAGDTALSMLPYVRTLTVLGYGDAQMALLELKAHSIAHLHPDNVYNLWGVHPSGRRVFVYHQLREVLSASTRGWWDRHESIIREGILQSGQLEQRHQELQGWIRKLNCSTMDEQPIRWGKRWSFLSKLFSDLPMSNLVEVPWHSSWRHMMLNREWNIDILQTGIPSLSYTGMSEIQPQLHRLSFGQEYLGSWLSKQAPESKDGVYLGRITQNVLMGSDGHERISNQLWDAIRTVLRPDGVVCCWQESNPDTDRFRWETITDTQSVHSRVCWVGRPV